ncbi:SGNH/GDSL hydrolase family protein [Cryobacterium frigoriphilum]|uniref:SGNH/GDSL hydrolase family protein n=1 Tax=Cryobacterium frigoriphilum TaxID=1259150 RepID=A0A4R9A9S6_9MICO|nr:SGNH/GDSL hydrolase family protein [Cryobacterium frigoriphilum]TFD54497.1 SGNH/GDSL hydrolase family protein [Cryobacterium frigoriphilum]
MRERRFDRYVALGDSFTEGVGDDLPDGTQRGWADLVALALAARPVIPAEPSARAGDSSVTRPLTDDSPALAGGTGGVQYANLAIRGKLLGPIVADQLEPALALQPTLLSICGGGNDVMRPRVEIAGIVALLDEVVQRATAQGAHVLMLTGGNPTRHLPMGALIQRRGDRLADVCRTTFTGADAAPGVTFVDNWLDAELAEPEYWSGDRLHLNARGHTRVAENVLHALGVSVPADWSTEGATAAGTGASAAPVAPAAARARSARYYRTHVLPWIGRRLTGRSSGDGRTAKRPDLLRVDRP